MAELCAKWELMSTDDSLDRYLQAVGVSEENREKGKTVLAAKLSQEISRDGNMWKIKVSTVAGETTHEYPEGESVDTTTLDGRKVKAMYRLEGNQLVETVNGDGFTSRNVRVVLGDTMTMTFTCGVVSSVRTYKKV